MKERLKHIQEALLAEVEKHMDDLSHVNAEEMGEVIDMIKDIEETIYYCTVTMAMENKYSSPKEEEHEEPKTLMQK